MGLQLPYNSFTILKKIKANFLQKYILGHQKPNFCVRKTPPKWGWIFCIIFPTIFSNLLQKEMFVSNLKKFCQYFDL